MTFTFFKPNDPAAIDWSAANDEFYVSFAHGTNKNISTQAEEVDKESGMIRFSSSRDIAVDDVSAGLPMPLEIVGGADK